MDHEVEYDFEMFDEDILRVGRMRLIRVKFEMELVLE